MGPEGTTLKLDLNTLEKENSPSVTSNQSK